MVIDTNSKFRINIIFLMVALIMAYYFSELRFGVNSIYENATPMQMVLGTAETPYQYRVLLAWLVKGLLLLPMMPETAVDGIFQVLEFLSVFALLVAFRVFLSLFFHHLLLASVLTFTLFYILPFNLLFNFWYPYDIPSLLFFTLALIALYRHSWGWYFLIFIPASFNRETTLLLTFLFVIVNWDVIPTKKLAIYTAVQLVVWVVIKLGLQNLYITNPGTAVQFTLIDNLRFLAQPGGWLWFLPNWGMLWVLVLIGYRWIADRFVKRALWVVFPLFLIMLLVGNIYELRIYAELIPIILLASLLIIQALFKMESTTLAS